MNSVHCENVTKFYHGLPAVQGLSLTVQQGEILALLGPSGCGKTTTLRLIAGFEKPEAGRIMLGEREVAGPSGCMPPERRQVGMVFQHYALFPHLTVAANVAYGLAHHTDRAARVREVLAVVGLSGLEARMPHELSGGQQQRVALARALAPRPQVLLLDEPFSNLDADRRATVRTQVREILKAVGTTAIFVTHDQEEALVIGDRVAVLNHGCLEQIAAPQELYARPATRFVAEFFGQPFFLSGRVAADGLHTELGFVAQPPSLPVGAPVDVLVRPDDVVLTPDANGSARITHSIFRGDSYLYEVALPSGRMVKCFGPHTTPYPLGTWAHVTLAPGHALACFTQAN